MVKSNQSGVNNNSYRHGMSGTRQFQAWADMKRRCRNNNTHNYGLYGGRGIHYCKEWEDFVSFWEDMREGYSDKLTLDRIDNDGGYCKENCKWSSAKEQARNRRKKVLYKHNGLELRLCDWAEKESIALSVLEQRVYRLKWSFKKAITTPARKRKTVT